MKVTAAGREGGDTPTPIHSETGAAQANPDTAVQVSIDMDSGTLKEEESIETEPDPDALIDLNVYLAERTQLIKRRDELGDTFDKGRVALAGGGIALSATIVKDLAPGKVALMAPFLYWGWLFLTLSLVVSLITLYLAGLSHERARQILDDDVRAGLKQPRKLKTLRRDGYRIHLGYLNPVSVGLLFAGLCLMGIAFGQAFGGIVSASNDTRTKQEESLKNMSENKQTTKEVKHVDATKSFGASDRPVTPSNPDNKAGQSGGKEEQKK